MNKLTARTGWTWLRQGVDLFRKQPAGLTMLLFANILISIAFSAVPIVGPLLAVVLIPSFSMAFMQACLMIDNGERVTPRVLLTGFRKPAVTALVKLGLVYLAVSVVLALVARFAIDASFWEQMAAQQSNPKKAQVEPSDMFAMFGVIVLQLVALMSLAFAAPLVYWQKMGPGKATFYSFFAVLRSARVFLVMLLAWFALFFAVCFVVTLIFGGADFTRVVIMWLIFLFVLLLQCAIYAGYRQIFGKPGAAAQCKAG
jgi:MFS family permease